MIITFAHYKGGTGKTTSCINVAGYLAKQGKGVLVVDLDPQGNATSGLGIDKNNLGYNMAHVMSRKADMKHVILATDIDNLHLAPTNQNLGMTNITAYSSNADARILEAALKSVKDHYDFVIIDTPPVHGHFIINGMVAADKIIVVLDPGIFALEGLHTLKKSYGDFFKNLGLDLKIDKILITKIQDSILPWKKKHAKEIKEDVEENYNERVEIIPYSEKVYDSQVKGLPLSHYKPRDKVGKAYKKIADEYLNLEEENEEEILADVAKKIKKTKKAKKKKAKKKKK